MFSDEIIYVFSKPYFYVTKKNNYLFNLVERIQIFLIHMFLLFTD